MKRVISIWFAVGWVAVIGPAQAAAVNESGPGPIQPLVEGKPHSGPLLLAGVRQQSADALYELEFWKSISDSKDPADYEAYLEAFPDGRFAPLAKARIKRLRKTATPAPQAPKPAQAPDFSVKAFDEEYVATTKTNVRSLPSASSAKVGELAARSSVRVTGKVVERNWYRVQLPNNREGFVYGPLLRQRVAAPPPPPKPVPPPPAVASTRATAGEPFKDCPDCPEMVPLPPGSFRMGSAQGYPSEKPAHSVSINYPFAIGRYEVTVAEWKQCVAAGACNSVDGLSTFSDRSPIRDVSWDDAQTYVRWLAQTTGKPYRLPSEAEWEYAARAGTTTKYWWGNNKASGTANCKDCGNDYNHDLPAEVGSLRANPFGLHDTSGNVWEWVSDCWHKNYSGAPRDGSSWDARNCRTRVIRGGAWRNDSSYVHSASRFKYDSYVRYLLNGFRVARDMN